MTVFTRHTFWPTMDSLTAPGLNDEIQNVFDLLNRQDQGLSRWTQVNTSESMFVGLAAVTGFSASVVSGGTLAHGTYYYKVYSFDANNIPGVPSPEQSATSVGTNQTVNLAWTAVPGAAYYRVSRGTSSGSQTGYFQTTSVSMSDSGQAFTGSGNAIQNNAGAITAYGTIDLIASQGSIRWYNYPDGLIGASISGTSAGEMEFATGKGTAQGNFLFDNSSAQQQMKISTESSPVTLLWSSSTDLIDGKIQSKTLTFVQNTLASPITSLTLHTTDITMGLVAYGVDGSASAPSWTFTSQHNLGWYWAGTNEMGASISGSQVLDVTATTFWVQSTSNQLKLGQTRMDIITAPTPATTDRTWTIPDNAQNCIFASREATETFSGAKTFTNTVFVNAQATNAYDLTNILYINPSAPASHPRVIRYNGAIATDQLIYCPANLDELRFATTSGTTVTDLFVVNNSTNQVVAGNGTSAVNLRINSQTGGGVSTGTLTNAPSASNPAVWIKININGTDRQIPCW